jgi:hypothetical protein
MIDHGAMQQCMRDRLFTLSVCSTGSTTLAATTAGYTRTTGSFITDGFAVGMELFASGFAKAANNGRKTITDVTDTLISCDGCVADVATIGRTLFVGIPAGRAMENMFYEPVSPAPWLEEQYIPGPQYLGGISEFARISVEPQYAIRIHVKEYTSTRAAHAYATALLNLFPPALVLTALPNGDVLKVRADLGPFRGQLLPSRPGFVVVPVTIPFRLHSINLV